MDTVRQCQHFSARSELRKVLFLAPSVCGFLYAYEISRELLNGFVPNSHGRRVWSLAWTSLKVKVKGQRSKVNVTRKKRHPSVISAVCVRFVFDKTSLASSFNFDVPSVTAVN